MRIRFVRPVDDRATDQGMPARQWPMKQKRDGPQTLVLQTRRICPGEHFPCAAVMIAARGTDGLQTRRWREMDSNLRFRARLVTVLSARLRPGQTAATGGGTDCGRPLLPID